MHCLRELMARLDDAGKKQMPFAVVKALTQTARQVATAEIAHSNVVFDNSHAIHSMDG